MHSGMIGKVEKARRYSRERDRMRFTQMTVSVDGDNGSHEVRYDLGGWECSCDFFAHRRTCAHTMALELVLEGMLPQEAAVA
ncbi:MAG: SWIM zinc finger family protein [Chloroflexi bacterium]|nr:SWIM zinc finger family protein [Chloroflexota bacterium]